MTFQHFPGTDVMKKGNKLNVIEKIRYFNIGEIIS